MLYYYHQNCFLFLLCAIIEASFGTSQERAVGETTSLSDINPRRKCPPFYCTCDMILKWLDVSCVDGPMLPRLFFFSFKHLHGGIFAGLSLYKVVLRDPETTAAEDVFEGMLTLIEFEVDESSIEVIPDFSFVSSIEKIRIESSRLTSLQGKHLQNLTKVRYFGFRNNSIKDIDPDIFMGTEIVETLDLSYNLLTSIPPKLLKPLKRLRAFFAIYNNLLHVVDLFYVTYPKDSMEKAGEFDLFEFDLSNNFIKETSPSLSYCNTNHDIALKTRNLNLNGNQLLLLKDFLKCLQVKVLYLNRNQIHFLAERDFVTVYGAETLFLNENQILRIDTNTFKPCKTTLLHLDLSSNKIVSINGSVGQLSQLTWLNLSHNSIQTFAEDEFEGLYNLKDLYLQHNQIKSLVTLQLSVGLKTLDISQNDIKIIKPNQIPKMLASIGLASNPFQRDCSIQPLFEFLREQQRKGYYKIDNDVFLLSDLSNTHKGKSNCPDICSCRCSEDGEKNFMLIDCDARKLSHVPQLFSNLTKWLDINGTMSSDDRHPLVIYQNMNTSLYVEESAIGLSLENNDLESLDAFELPPNLVYLSLANNKIRRFPKAVFENQLNLKQVFLSRNPWICDCDTLEFKKWLTSNKNIIRDFNNIFCEKSEIRDDNLNESAIWSLSDDELCPALGLSLSILVTFGLLASGTFCLGAKVLYTKYELPVKLFLYRNGFTFVKDNDLDYKKDFDAFISFSHKDDEFVVKEIVAGIERRNPDIHLCLHYRHFIAGELIASNITRAVRSSKRTLLILSNNFLDSEWCILEFKTARMHALQEKHHKIIAIKLGDLTEEIPPALENYLATTTYLTYGEFDFWNKLLFILPSGGSARKPGPRFKVNDSVYHFSSTNV